MKTIHFENLGTFLKEETLRKVKENDYAPLRIAIVYEPGLNILNLMGNSLRDLIDHPSLTKEYRIIDPTSDKENLDPNKLNFYFTHKLETKSTPFIQILSIRNHMKLAQKCDYLCLTPNHRKDMIRQEMNTKIGAPLGN